MKYYIYFDAYEHPREAIDEKELAQEYNGDPENFLKAMCDLTPDMNTKPPQQGI